MLLRITKKTLMLSDVKIYQRHMLMYESPLMQHWHPQWLGADRQQDIAKANADPNQCCHVASLGHNELRSVS